MPKEAKKLSKPKKRYYRKRVDFYLLVNKIKLWPSRKGILHGVRKITKKGNYAEITTHCGCSFLIRLSKNSRAARWLRNKWFFKECRKCRIPSWKLEKFASTQFAQHYGSTLEESDKVQ
ncbi:MAG: pyrrolysine--tRNA(Pyl) ligase small subunit [Thermoanaerobacterales bacterium]|nr:pyrrolysine--tRNA(Pyl) ligase small subunit [Thermoanaerobacterales bacterium]